MALILGDALLDGDKVRLKRGGNSTDILAGSPASPITLSLPTITDTLVGRATTDTLTNKTISGANNTVTNITASASLVDSSINTAKIADSAVTLAKIQNISGLSLLGRSSNSSGVLAPIVAGTDHHVLRRSGSSIGFGLIGNANISGTANIAYSKLNLNNSIVNADVASAAAIAYSKLNLTGSIVNADIASAAAIAFNKLANGSAVSVLGRSANNSGSLASIAAGTDHFVLRRSGSSLGFGLLTNNNIDASAAIAGTKINPDFGSQDVITTGLSTAGRFNPTSSSASGTGMFRPAANTLGFALGGVDQFRMSGSQLQRTGGGDVTTVFDIDFPLLSTASGSLQLFRNTDTSGTGTSFLIYQGLNDGSTQHRLFAKNGQNSYLSQGAGSQLGVGTVAPTERFDVNGVSRFRAQIKSSDGSASSPAYSFNDDTNTGMFRAGANRLGLAVNATERFRITGVGMGNGNFDPAAPIHLRGGSTNNELRFEGPNNDDTYFRLYHNAGGGNDFGLQVRRFDGSTTHNSYVIGSSAANHLWYAKSGAELARFDNSNQLGINTTSPTERLDVDGNVRVRGELKLDATSTFAFDGDTGSTGQLPARSATGMEWVSPLTNPMTTEGDLIVGGTGGVATRATKTDLIADDTTPGLIPAFEDWQDFVGSPFVSTGTNLEVRIYNYSRVANTVTAHIVIQSTDNNTNAEDLMIELPYNIATRSTNFAAKVLGSGTWRPSGTVADNRLITCVNFDTDPANHVRFVRADGGILQEQAFNTAFGYVSVQITFDAE